VTGRMFSTTWLKIARIPESALALVTGFVLMAPPALGQSTLDRADSTTRSQRPADDLPAQRQSPVQLTVQRQDAVVAAEASVMLGAVTIAGLQVLRPADFADIIEKYVGRFASTTDLSALANNIADRARARGYAFATAQIMPQQIKAGVIVVSVDEGRIDALRLEGTDLPAVRRVLAPLANGAPVTAAEVERRLLIAGDIDGVLIKSSRYVREGDRGILVVRAAGDGISGRIGFENAGTKPLGPEQASVEIDVRRLLLDDDSLTLSYVGTPAEPDELNFVRGRYAAGINRSGTRLVASASYSRTHPGAYLRPLDIDGMSWQASLGVQHPLARNRSRSIWINASIDIRDIVQASRNLRVRHDRLTVARIGLYGYRPLLGGRVRVNALLSQGLDLFSATQAGDPLASRLDADGSFTSFNIWADWTRALGGGFSVRTAFDAQIASQALLVSEEMGLGGTSFVRGYDWSERSGDQGIAGMIELRYDIDRPLKLAKSVQLYAFVDGGHVGNLAGGTGGGSLASAGGGVRTSITHKLNFSIEAAVPLSGARYDTQDETPRLHAAIGQSF